MPSGNKKKARAKAKAQEKKKNADRQAKPSRKGKR